MKYPTSSLVAINDCALMDARLKFAMQLLFNGRTGVDAPLGKYCSEAELAKTVSDLTVLKALDMADILFEMAEVRGWIEPLPLDATIQPAELAHVERGVGAQIHAQVVGQRVQQDIMSRSVVMPNGKPVLNG